MMGHSNLFRVYLKFKDLKLTDSFIKRKNYNDQKNIIPNFKLKFSNIPISNYFIQLKNIKVLRHWVAKKQG